MILSIGLIFQILLNIIILRSRICYQRTTMSLHLTFNFLSSVCFNLSLHVHLGNAVQQLNI